MFWKILGHTQINGKRYAIWMIVLTVNLFCGLDYVSLSSRVGSIMEFPWLCEEHLFQKYRVLGITVK
jgi:hypothetical protein